MHSPTASAKQRKIADLYRSFMDSRQLETLGLKPLATDLKNIDDIKTLAQLIHYLGAAQASALNLPIQLAVAPNSRDPQNTQLQLEQAGLGLPNRDYYLGQDDRLLSARQAYRDYLQTLFAQAGLAVPASRVQAVMALEQQLARIQWDNVRNRDPKQLDNPLDSQQLQALSPQMPWHDFFRAAQLPPPATVNVNQPSYFAALGPLLVETPLATWRDYVRARLLDAYAPYLNQAMRDADFNFHQKTLDGTTQPKPRWKDGVSLVEMALGNALGQLYVADYFPASAKQKTEQLVKNLMSAFQQSIRTLPWMTDATRQAALEKLAHYTVKIGYPDQWRDYSQLSIQPKDLIGNVKRYYAFQYRYTLDKLGRPVDKNEWFMTPQTVNAYYEPLYNEIVFPAGILQPPFFNATADDAVNYGGIGSVIGHEISHGFDDQGSQYDEKGRLRDWWNQQDRQRFNALTARLVTQYQAYTPLPGHAVNGKLTLGENIADNAGLQVAYKAYQLSLKGQPAPVIDGLTGSQRFFIGFTQIWRAKFTDAALLKQLLNDPHTPANYRPLGAVVNSDAFFQAFAVAPADQMFKPADERIKIW